MKVFTITQGKVNFLTFLEFESGNGLGNLWYARLLKCLIDISMHVDMPVGKRVISVQYTMEEFLGNWMSKMNRN